MTLFFLFYASMYAPPQLEFLYEAKPTSKIIFNHLQTREFLVLQPRRRAGVQLVITIRKTRLEWIILFVCFLSECVCLCAMYKHTYIKNI